MGLFFISDIKGLCFGAEDVKAAYIGSEQVWPVGGLPAGKTFDFDYTGTVQSVDLPAGRYKLQCWGAQGGSVTGSVAATGSNGGYSEGVLTLTETTTLYIFVGGKGGDYMASLSTTPSYTAMNGGWNGGGKGYRTARANEVGDDGRSFPRPGGGATDICLVTSGMSYSSGRTNRIKKSLLSRFIVAGGGAGASGYYREVSNTKDEKLGTESHTTRYDFTADLYDITEEAPTITTGASTLDKQGGGVKGKGVHPGDQISEGINGGFGYGGNVSSYVYRFASGAGGGGWHGGGCVASDSNPSYINKTGGGSGFVNTAENASSRPSNYTGLQLDSGRTIAGDTSHPSINGGTEIGHNGNGYARITVMGNNLPAGYTRVTYVEFTGKQYVDTGFIPSNTTKLWMDFEIPTPVVGNVYYGVRNNSYADSFLLAYSSTSGKLRTQFGSQTVDHNATIKGRHEITHDQNVVTLDGVTKSHTVVTFTSPDTLYLGADHRNGNAESKATFRIYGCKIYADGVLVRDFVPVTNTEGTKGLFDLVTYSFYPSASGTNLD